MSEPIVENGVLVDLNLIMKEMDGSPIKAKNGKDDKRLGEYLWEACGRNVEEEDEIAVIALGLKIYDKRGQKMKLGEDNGLTMLKRVVKVDCFPTPIGGRIKAPAVLRGRAMLALEGKGGT